MGFVSYKTVSNPGKMKLISHEMKSITDFTKKNLLRVFFGILHHHFPYPAGAALYNQYGCRVKGEGGKAEGAGRLVETVQQRSCNGINVNPFGCRRIDMQPAVCGINMQGGRRAGFMEACRGSPACYPDPVSPVIFFILGKYTDTEYILTDIQRFDSRLSKIIPVTYQAGGQRIICLNIDCNT